jgi:hypothetical protein
MRDRLFFPLSATLAAAFVFMAIQPFADRPPRGPLSAGGRNVEDVTLQDRELYRFLPGNYNGLQIIKPQDGQPTLLRITRQAEEIYENPQYGPHILLDSDIELGLEARTIEVVIEARSTEPFPASRFEAFYQARPDAGSGWIGFDLTRDFAPYTFQFETPPLGVMSYDWFAIRPVAPDKLRTMEVKSVRFHAVSPKRPDATQSN